MSETNYEEQREEEGLVCGVVRGACWGALLAVLCMIGYFALAVAFTS